MKARSFILALLAVGQALALSSATVLLVLLLAACAKPQMGIEPTPTPGPTVTAMLALPATPSAQPATLTATLQATTGLTFPTATFTHTPTRTATATRTPTATHTPSITRPPTRTPTVSPVPTQSMVQVQPTLLPTLTPASQPGPTVTPMPCAEAICLTASPMPVAPDGIVTLNWNAPGAVKVEIWWWDNKQQESIIHSDLLPVGSVSFSIGDAHIENIGAYVYVSLTAYYADGEVESKGLYISVRTRHTITAFTVSPQTVNPGEIVTLSWDIAGEVQEVSLYTLNELSQLDTSYSDLPASGSLTLTVPAWRRNAMSFQLYASDPDGLWTLADTFVKIACPDVWFFPNPPSDCPWPATYTKMAVQHFEHGVMIWTEWEDRIRVFYNDSQDVHLRRWEMRNNEWFPGMPESDPNIVPPPGYYQPVRGFGKLWREGSHWDGTSIRDLLGWAMEPEFAIDHGVVQCDTSPKYNTCYLGDPVGVVYSM